MKKIFIVLLVLSVVATFFVIPVGAESRVSSNSYDIMVEFVTENPARTSGSDGAESSANYIKEYFDGIEFDKAGKPELTALDDQNGTGKVYETKIQEFTYEVYTSQGRGFMSYYPTIEKVKDRNVIATKKSANKDAKTVIIGAHYDNAQDQNQGSGAYDNGSGIGVMLSLAERVKDMKFDYNLVFVAFGAHEYYFEGSAKFVQSLSLSEKNDISLYINLDSIAGGDNLYVYADEVKTIQEEYFLQIAKKLAVNLNPAHFNKGTYYSEYTKLGYSHVGLDSDNLPFFNENVLTVSFSSHNWTMMSSGILDESADKPNIIGTKDDTVEKLELLYGEKVKTRMNGVENIIFSALTSTDFISEMQRAKTENADYSLITNRYFIPLICLGFMIIVVVLVVLLNKKYRGKKPSNTDNDLGNGQKGGERPRVFEDFD